MKITDIEVRVGVTVNLGNYESLRVDYQARAEIEEGEKASEVIDKTRNYLKKKMAEDLEKTNGGRNFMSPDFT